MYVCLFFVCIFVLVNVFLIQALGAIPDVRVRGVLPDGTEISYCSSHDLPVGTQVIRLDTPPCPRNDDPDHRDEKHESLWWVKAKTVDGRYYLGKVDGFKYDYRFVGAEDIPYNLI
jgi:hypothetical protein